MTEIRTLFNHFLYYSKAIRNYRPITLRNYRQTIDPFLKDSGFHYLEELNKDVIHNWFIKGRIERRWSAAARLTWRVHRELFR